MICMGKIMNKNDINRMLDMVDEKYIIETEPGKNHKKNEKENRWTEGMKGVLAAALLLFVFGITYLAADRLFLTHKGENETKSHWEQSSREEEDTAKETDKKETENQEKMNQKYASIFKPVEKKTETVSQDITLQAGGVEYRYDTIKDLTTIPFVSWGFQEGTADVFYNEAGTPENMMLSLWNDEKHKKMILTVIGSGDFYSCYKIEEGDPVDWNGIQVYGYENSDDMSLSMHFRVNGIGYSVECFGMDYWEAGKILDGIMAGEVSADDFDISKGIKVSSEYKDITIAEAGKLEAFQNCMTNLTRINDLVLENQQCSYTIGYENDVPAWEYLSMEYRNGGYDYIDVSYGTTDIGVTNVLKLTDLTPESVGKYKYNSDVEGNNWYSFSIDFGNGYIGIQANCREEELWEFLESIKG